MNFADDRPPPVMHRRQWLRQAGFWSGAAALGGAAWWYGRQWWHGDDTDVIGRGRVNAGDFGVYPAPRDATFAYERNETPRVAAARYTNFYEFSRTKAVWRFVDDFEPAPWTLTIDGLCRQPLKLDLDALHRRYRDDLVERAYRHRCVERWAMCVPWTGVPLARVLKDVDPLASATHVRFIAFDRPQQAGHQRDRSFPWPYEEGLTIAEAKIDLVLLAAGMYGEPLLKQHGAPLRLVVPWKYGYKSIKSVTRIELVDREPATFWSTINPTAYPFESNVDPQGTVPWPQATERMLGSGETFPTQLYNGYEREVAHLYPT
jgi:sulfoxide reductase catalytic subunit YedY